MKKFMLITNNEKHKNVLSANELKELIEKKGGQVVWSVMPAPGDLSPMSVPEDVSAIITIGGDGTMVRSAQRTLGSGVPLIGINKGHLGYLCDINEANLEEAIDRLMEGSYFTQERMMVTGSILRCEGTCCEAGVALNDVVLTCASSLTLIRINIYVNGTFLYGFNGDGIIISTPTGSTGYNLSAGGPIVDPGSELMLLTPINPHTLNSRSIVLDSRDRITIMAESRRSGRGETASVAFDGGRRQKLSQGDRLVVEKAGEKTRFIRLDETSFLERMKTRLGG